MADISPNVYEPAQLADGTQTNFDFHFSAMSEDELIVVVDGVEIDHSFYTATTGDAAGTVHFDAPPQAGSEVLIISDPDYVQASSFEDQAAYNLETVNKINRRQAIRALVLKDSVDRAFQLPLGEVPAPLPPADARRGTVFTFDQAAGAVDLVPKSDFKGPPGSGGNVIASRADLAAFNGPTIKDAYYVTEVGAEGTFTARPYAEVAAEADADTYNAMVFRSEVDPDLAWVRDVSDGKAKAAWFGVVGDGATVNTTRFQAAIDYCSQFGLQLLGDGPTRVAGGLRIERSLRMDGVNNFTILQGTERGPSGGLGIEIAPPVGTARNVVSITKDQTIPASPAGVGYVHTTRVELDSVAGLTAGDVLHIRSDDAWGFDAGARKGELFQIGSIDAVNNYVYPTKPIYHDYATNPTARALSNEKVEIGPGVTFSYDGDPFAVTGDNTTRRIMALTVTGAVMPTIQARFENDFAWGLSLFSCWRPNVRTFHRNIRCNFQTGMIGVCVNVQGATTGGWCEVYSEKTGHSYDEGVWPTNPTQPIRDGAPLRNHCANSKAIGTTVAAFNTHPGSFEPTFLNCFAEGGWTSSDTTAGSVTTRNNTVGFQDRAFQGRWENCSTRNMQAGFTISSQNVIYGKRNRPVIIGGSHSHDFAVNHTFAGLATATTTDDYLCTFKGVEGTGYAPAQAAQTALVAEYVDCVFSSAGSYGLVLADNTGPQRFTRCTFRDFNVVRWGAGNNIEMEDCLRINISVASVEAMTFYAPGTHTVDCLFKAASYSGNLLINLAGTGAMTLRVGRLRSPNYANSTPIGKAGTVTLTMATYDHFQPPVRQGTTANRPVPLAGQIGYRYLDTTLDADGKPIWWNGTAWVDATGATV